MQYESASFRLTRTEVLLTPQNVGQPHVVETAAKNTISGYKLLPKVLRVTPSALGDLLTDSRQLPGDKYAGC